MHNFQFWKLTILFLFIFSGWFFGLAGTGTIAGEEKSPLSKNIRCIIQDKSGNYWFGSEGEGVTRYNGKTYTTYTMKDGLCSNYIRGIQEDAAGKLWFTTRDGICSYDGTSFITYPKTGANSLLALFGNVTKNLRGNLWFWSKGGAFRYDGRNFQFFPIPVDSTDAEYYKKDPGLNSGAYSAYCVTEDKDGNIWFGTEQRGVCRYDGKQFTWIRGKGLDKAAVRCIFQDRQGVLWFVNNGMGVCRYDGKQLTNFTEENGLSNTEFIKTMKSKMGTLARVWSVNEDKEGNLWFATVDAGLWRYNGKTIINYTTKDGPTSNTVWHIYKDKSNTLWFGTEGGGVFTYDGKTFNQFPLNQK